MEKPGLLRSTSQRAFDKVCHKSLIRNLKSHGISGELFDTIYDFLASRQITVVHEGQSSPVHQTDAADPQGVRVGSNIVHVVYQ